MKLYGSPADKADLEVADEILEINGKPLQDSSHTEVINHIHNVREVFPLKQPLCQRHLYLQCIKSRTICLRVKRRTGNKLGKDQRVYVLILDVM